MKVRLVTWGFLLAVNCFPATVLMGLEGHGLPIPVEVAKHLSAGERHEALRGLLFNRALETRAGELADEDEEKTLDRMMESLQPGQSVWHEVSTFVADLYGDNVTVNVIMGVTAMEALTVNSYAGEQKDRYSM